MPSQVSWIQCLNFSIDFLCFVSGDIELIHPLLFLHCVMSQDWFQPLSFIFPNKT